MRWRSSGSSLIARRRSDAAAWGSPRSSAVPPGRGDVQQGTLGKHSRVLESVAELDAIPVGLLEVVADDEVVLARIDARPMALQPPREVLVEVGPLALG